MKNPKQFIGRKVKGVKFKNYEYNNLIFNENMEPLVGVEGVIKEYDEKLQRFLIDFGFNSWYYPAELILSQFEEEIIGYVINDEKYIKIIASLCDVQEKVLMNPIKDNIHFSKDSFVEKVVKEFDLLDKCTPVYKEVKINKLPKINGYDGEDNGDYIKYGCANLPKSWFSSSDNRSIESMILDSGVVINRKEISEIIKYLDYLKK